MYRPLAADVDWTAMATASASATSSIVNSIMQGRAARAASEAEAARAASWSGALSASSPWLLGAAAVIAAAVLLR
jgi:hypothetical protein